MGSRAINPKISLKLIVDNSSGKVLFAEAGKDFVDFLFGLFELPVGTVLGLLDKHDKGLGSGSLSRIYESVKNLDNSYLQTNQTKISLLSPNTRPSNTNHAPLLKQLAYPNQKEVVQNLRNASVYTISNNGRVSFVPAAASSSTNNNVVQDGYVKGVMNYMVMDDLTIKPMSTISSVTLLNTLNVKDPGCLQEKTVEVNIDKGLKIFMRTVYHSTTVLTDVFLPIEPPKSSKTVLGRIRSFKKTFSH